MSLLNGHGAPKDENVTSLDEARKRAAAKKKMDARAAGPSGPRTARDWIIGGLFFALALGLIGSLIMRFMPASGGG